MEKQEHWKTNDAGQLKGVWGLDLSKITRGDDWSKIDQIITEWTKLHPYEMAEHILFVKELNSVQKNDTASSKEGLRYGVEIPTGLGIQLQLILPELFTNKTLLHKFMKRYKGFTVATRV
jgi:hypothetical protein